MDPIMFGMFATRQDDLDKAVDLLANCGGRDNSEIQAYILNSCDLRDITSDEINYIVKEVNRRI